LKKHLLKKVSGRAFPNRARNQDRKKIMVGIPQRFQPMPHALKVELRVAFGNNFFVVDEPIQISNCLFVVHAKEFLSDSVKQIKRVWIQGAHKRPRRRSETYAAQGSEVRNAGDEPFSSVF